MVEFMQQYGTEAKAYRALYLHEARWPHGFRCPACAVVFMADSSLRLMFEIAGPRDDAACSSHSGTLLPSWQEGVHPISSYWRRNNMANAS